MLAPLLRPPTGSKETTNDMKRYDLKRGREKIQLEVRGHHIRSQMTFLAATVEETRAKDT